MRVLFIIAAIAATCLRADASARPKLLAFGSSDSCAWCELMEKRVFSSDAWRTWAATNLLVETVDLPRGEGRMSDEIRERNEALADSYGVEGFPTFVLVTPDGKTELGRVKVPDPSRGLGRDLTAETFIAALQQEMQKASSPASAWPSLWRKYRFIPVVILLVLAAMLLTDKSKLPLALRGLGKILGTRMTVAAASAAAVPRWKRLLAFALIVLAFLLAVLSPTQVPGTAQSLTRTSWKWSSLRVRLPQPLYGWHRALLEGNREFRRACRRVL